MKKFTFLLAALLSTSAFAERTVTDHEVTKVDIDGNGYVDTVRLISIDHQGEQNVKPAIDSVVNYENLIVEIEFIKEKPVSTSPLAGRDKKVLTEKKVVSLDEFPNDHLTLPVELKVQDVDGDGDLDIAVFAIYQQGDPTNPQPKPVEDRRYTNELNKGGKFKLSKTIKVN